MTTIIPAQPGFTLLTFYQTDGIEVVRRSPVIGWTVIGRHCLPIALCPPANNAISTGILCPDGRVIDPGHTIFDDQHEWMEDARERAAADKKYDDAAAE